MEKNNRLHDRLGTNTLKHEAWKTKEKNEQKIATYV